MTRRALLLVPAAALLVLSAGCSTSTDNAASGGNGASVQDTASGSSSPVASATASTSSASIPESGGTDAIGGSVSADLTKKPELKVPGGARPTKLQTKDIVKGTGPVAGPNATVNVQYLGVNYADGKEFDSSWAHGGQPVSFPLSGVIPGFAQGIVGMHVGGRREIVIPSDLGYGPQGGGPVKPNEDLIFVVDLVGVQQ